jgi:hypothetical protein
MKGVLKHADRLEARYVAWIEGEVAQLKDMQSGEQSQLPPDGVVRTVLRGPGL